MSKHITDFMRGKVIALFEQNLKLREISKETNVPKSTVGDIVLKYKKYNSTKRLLGSGRRTLLDSNELEILKKLKTENPRFSVPKLNLLIEREVNKKIGHQTLRNTLHKLEYFARSPVRKPVLSPQNIIKRIETATTWYYSPDSYWDNVIFSDETKFNLFSSDGISWVWRQDGLRYDSNYINETKKYGGGHVCFWGCFSKSGVGNLVVVNGIMDSMQYVTILSNNLVSSAENLNLGEYKFQHDNDAKHCSMLTKNFLAHNNIAVIPWPSQSPDLNPIENLWAFIKKKLNGKVFKKKDDLINEVKGIWNTITPEMCNKLILSMRKRCGMVIKAKGKHIKY